MIVRLFAFSCACLVACSSASPVPPRAAPAAPAIAPPITPPAPAAACYRPRFDAIGRLVTFAPRTTPLAGPALDTFDRSRPLRIAYASCTERETAGPREPHCRIADRAAALALAPTFFDPPFWHWAEQELSLSDAQLDAAAAQRVVRGVERSLRTSAPFDAGADLIVVITMETWEQHEIYESYGCSPNDKCDPVSRPTGRHEWRRQAPVSWTTYRGLVLPGYVDGTGEWMRLVDPSIEPHDQPLYFLTPYPCGDADRTGSLWVALEHGRAAFVETAENATEPDPIVRLAVAYDLAVLAARAHDMGRFHRAFQALSSALASDRAGAPIDVTSTIDAALPVLTQIERGEVTLDLPRGLEAYRSWYTQLGPESP